MMFVIHAIIIETMRHPQKQTNHQKSNKYLKENQFRNVLGMLYGLIFLRMLELVCVNVV